MTTPASTAPKSWTHRYTADGWQVIGSDGSWVASFARFSDCLTFMRLAGPQHAQSGGAR